MPAGFRDEQLLLIAPGSQTTLAQLGLPESFGPSRWRFPTMMIEGQTPNTFQPYVVKEKEIVSKASDAATTSNGDHKEADTQMTDGVATESTNGQTEIPVQSSTEQAAQVEEKIQTTYEDDFQDREGAVYPIQGGHIVNFPCFFALLWHVYNTVSPPFHSPVLLVSQPCWTARDHEILTQFFFEHFKIPAFCIVDAALTATYAYGVQNAIVVDVGYDKCDVTAVIDYAVNQLGRAAALEGCGGRSMTRRLCQLLQNKDFTEDMAEQLKRSAICEILPLGISLPNASQNGEVINPAAAASTGALDSGANAKDMDGLRPGQAPRGPGLGTEVGEEGGNGEDDDNEGVLDVAAIVAKDNAAELLAKREQERAAKELARKGRLAEAARPMRLKNSEREKATFSYEEVGSVDRTDPGSSPNRKRKREVEVGVERFGAASPVPGESEGIIDKIAAAIHSTVSTYPDASQRSALWDNLIVLGQGSKIRGFVPALLSVLAARYTLSPSNATMGKLVQNAHPSTFSTPWWIFADFDLIFTSELPSNFSTPLATTPGTNTPVPGMQPHPLHHPAAHGVNPLLVAATRPQMPQPSHLQIPHQLTPDLHLQHSHRQYSQTPTSIKTVKGPEYFPELRENQESHMGFLGAQVAAKVIFVADGGTNKGFLTRVEFNEMGPSGIHEVGL